MTRGVADAEQAQIAVRESTRGQQSRRDDAQQRCKEVWPVMRQKPLNWRMGGVFCSFTMAILDGGDTAKC